MNGDIPPGTLSENAPSDRFSLVLFSWQGRGFVWKTALLNSAIKPDVAPMRKGEREQNQVEH